MCVYHAKDYLMFHVTIIDFLSIIQIYSGITCGGVLNGEFYTKRLHKLIYLYFSKDCFMTISLQTR